MSSVAAVILAAGRGTRLPSPRPKALQTLLGEAMISHVCHALGGLDAVSSIWTVVGHEADQVRAHMNKNFGFSEDHCILQAEQLGTGHALLCALNGMQAVPGFTPPDKILLVNADVPLLTAPLLNDFIVRAMNTDIAFMTLNLEDPAAYGRVIRENRSVSAIVEAKDFARLYGNRIVHEVNSGIYLFDFAVVRDLLPQISNSNASNEYYLTDVVSLGVEKGLHVDGIECGNDAGLLGVNNPRELAAAEKALQQRRLDELMAGGVVIHAPESVRISPFSTIEAGVEIYGPCEIYGHSHLAYGVCVESHCHFENTRIGEKTHIRSYCHFENAEIAASCTLGPFARLRPGADLADEVHIGNFVEVKKSTVAKGSKINHLTYIGDSQIGSHVNVGAGCITCNYDGKNKFRTVIGDNAFLGSNCSFVAPVSIGSHTLIAAGSTITKDVPDNALAFGRAKQVIKEKK